MLNKENQQAVDSEEQKVIDIDTSATLVKAQNFLNNPTKEEFKEIYPFMDILLKNSFKEVGRDENDYRKHNFLGALFLSEAAIEVVIDVLDEVKKSKGDETVYNFTAKSIYIDAEVRLYEAIPEDFNPINYSPLQNYLIYESMQGVWHQHQKQTTFVRGDMEDYYSYKKYWAEQCEKTNSLETAEIKDFLTKLENLAEGRDDNELNDELLAQVIDFENKQEYEQTRLMFFRLSAMVFVTTLLEMGPVIGSSEKKMKNSTKLAKELTSWTEEKRCAVIDIASLACKVGNINSNTEMGHLATAYPYLQKMHKTIKPQRVIEEKYQLDKMITKPMSNTKPKNKI